MTEQQKTTNEPKYQQKTLDAFKLVQAGIEPRQALQAVNYTNKISAESVSKFKAKFKKHSLQTPAMVKLAHHAIKDCLTDKPIKQTLTKKDKEGKEIEIIEETVPTWTNKIAAASMVYDRAEPIVRSNLNVNANMDVHPVDLSRWSNVQSGADDGQMPTSGSDYVDITSGQSDPHAK